MANLYNLKTKSVEYVAVITLPNGDNMLKLKVFRQRLNILRKNIQKLQLIILLIT